jgi:hypothetical protein
MLPTAITNPPKGIVAKIVCPRCVTVNKLPPLPDRLPAYVHVTATLHNPTRSNFSLLAPTPGEVNFWELYEDSGRLIQTELHSRCLQSVLNAHLPAGGRMRIDNSIALNGRLLLDRQKYTIRYKFWGYYSEARFTAQCLE